MKTKEQYINAEQVMSELGIAKATLYRWMKEGIIPYYKLGNKTLFKLEEVKALIRPGGHPSGEDLPGEVELDEALAAFEESDRDQETFTHADIKAMAAEMLSAFQVNRQRSNP